MNKEIEVAAPRQVARIPTAPNGNGYITPGDGGRPNRLRGMGKDSAYFNISLALIQEFPIGSELSQDTFDEFVARMRKSEQFGDRAEDIGLYTVPVGDAKNSGEHALYLKRRNELRYNLSNAATTPRMIVAMTEFIGKPGSGFRLDVPRAGWIIVRASLDAFIDSGVSSSIERWILSEQKKLRHLQQSLGYDGLDPSEKELLDECAEEIGYFGQDTVERHKRLQAKCYRARTRIERMVAEKAPCLPGNGE